MNNNWHLSEVEQLGSMSSQRFLIHHGLSSEEVTHHEAIRLAQGVIQILMPKYRVD